MEIRRERENKILTISQQKYINDLLRKYKMSECDPVPTPQATTVVLEMETTMTIENIRPKCQLL
jgi:hypothetical protein